jgi:hypothetical protein
LKGLYDHQFCSKYFYDFNWSVGIWVAYLRGRLMGCKKRESAFTCENAHLNKLLIIIIIKYYYPNRGKINIIALVD